MKKIAVIFESSPFDRKGQFNAAHERIRHLVASGECEIDAYCIHSRDNAFTRKVRTGASIMYVWGLIVWMVSMPVIMPVSVKHPVLIPMRRIFRC